MKRTIAIVFLLSLSFSVSATPYWYGIAEIYYNFSDDSNDSDAPSGIDLGGRLGIGLQLNERFGIEGQWETASSDLDDLDIPGGLREQFELTTDQGLSIRARNRNYTFRQYF